MIQTGNDRSNYPPQVSTLAPNERISKDKQKHFKVFSSLEQYLSSIEQIRLIDQLMRPIKKSQKEETIKRVNAILLQIKDELDEIEFLCKYFSSGKEQIFVEAQLITLSEWKAEIKKIDKMINSLLDFINQNLPILGSIYNLETKVFNVGAKQWRKKCEGIMKSITCSCMKV